MKKIKIKKQLKFRRSSIIIISIAFLFSIFLQSNAQAAITKQINYQGKLTDDTDNVVPDGSYDMILSIYDAASGGNLLWTARGTTGSPSSRSVSVVKGLFSIMLGDTSAGDNAINLDFNSTYYLGVTVGTDNEMTPRKMIGASGYAFNSDLLDGLDSATSGTDAHIMATDSSGNLTISGNTYFNGTTYYIDSTGTGNLNILNLTGDADVKGGDITNTLGALTVTPLAGSNFNVDLSTTGDFAVNTNQFYVDTSSGNVGIGTAAPTAYLNITAGTATAGTAPLKFTAGTNLTAPEAGAVEWDGTNLYITQTSGPTRKTIAFDDSAMTGTFDGINLATGTQGGVPYFSSTTQLTSSTAGTTGQALISGGTGSPTWYAPTAGSVIFAGTDGVLDQDNPNLFWDNANNRLGIGTATPTGVLTTSGEAHLFQGGYTDPVGGTLAAVKMSANSSLVTPTTSFAAGVNGAAGADLNTYAAYLNNASTVSGTGINYGIYAIGNNNYFSGNVGIGTAAPTAYLNITAGTATAGTAPLKFTAGTNLTAPEAGAVEWDGTNLYITQTSGPTRKTIAFDDSAMTGTFDGINLATGTQGGVSYFSSTTQLTSSTAGTTGQALISGGTGSPTWYAPTAGSILFAGTSGILSQKNSNLFWDDTNNRLGIGTASPGGTLSIVSANTTGTTTSSALNLSANSLTTGTGLYAASSTLTSGKLVDLQVSGTAAAASQTALNILTAGANATSGITTYGGYISNTHTNATSGTNVALYLNASGATTANYGLIVNAGRVGITNTAPGALLDIGTAGSTLGTLRLEGNTSGYVQINTAAAAGSWTWTLPVNDGTNGRQLTTDGNGVTSWSAANSLREMKNIEGLFDDPNVALDQIINTPVYRFHYKPGEGTLDSNTEYVGVMADEAPWAMHYEGTIINPVNTLGYMVLGVQALNQKISPLTETININSGSVGIGTSSPSQMLTIGNGTNQGNVYIANGYLCVDDNGTCAIGSPTAGSVYAVNAYTTGADYAEYFYTEDTDLKNGEAVCVDTENDNAIKRCENDGDNNIMGIVSSNPSIVGNRTEEQNSDPDHYKIIGMMGQVAGLVSTENGEIKVGDNLTASAIPGYMRKANAGESTVGLAMEDFKGVKGTVQVLISRRNQSLTVEKVEETVLQNIKNMDVEDQVNKIVAEAKTNLDMQIENTNQTLQEIQDSLIQTNSEVASVQALQIKLQKQMDDIMELTNTASEFISTLSISDILYKDAFGNLDLGKGKLKAVEVSAGVFAVNIIDEDAPTIGEATICPEMTEAGKDGKCDKEQVDKNEDDVDDDTDNPISNGKKVEIKTTAVGEGSKIFVTAKDVTNATLAVTDIDKGKGFTVEIKESTEEAIKFDWWVVEKKE